jgi:hypothetical protein
MTGLFGGRVPGDGNLGTFNTPSELQTEFPAGTAGRMAMVGAAAPFTAYIDNGIEWIVMSGRERTIEFIPGTGVVYDGVTIDGSSPNGPWTVTVPALNFVLDGTGPGGGGASGRGAGHTQSGGGGAGAAGVAVIGVALSATGPITVTAGSPGNGGAGTGSALSDGNNGGNGSSTTISGLRNVPGVVSNGTLQLQGGFGGLVPVSNNVGGAGGAGWNGLPGGAAAGSGANVPGGNATPFASPWLGGTLHACSGAGGGSGGTTSIAGGPGGTIVGGASAAPWAAFLTGAAPAPGIGWTGGSSSQGGGGVGGVSPFGVAGAGGNAFATGLGAAVSGSGFGAGGSGGGSGTGGASGRPSYVRLRYRG